MCFQSTCVWPKHRQQKSWLPKKPEKLPSKMNRQKRRPNHNHLSPKNLSQYAMGASQNQSCEAAREVLSSRTWTKSRVKSCLKCNCMGTRSAMAHLVTSAPSRSSCQMQPSLSRVESSLAKLDSTLILVVAISSQMPTFWKERSTQTHPRSMVFGCRLRKKLQILA